MRSSKLFIPFVLLFFSYSICAQQSEVINRLLLSEQEDTWKNSIEEAEGYIELSYQFLNSDVEKAKSYAEKGLSIARKIDCDACVASALMRLGVLARKEGKYKEALTHLKEALNAREQVGTAKDIASTNNSIGLVYKDLQESMEAKNYFLAGISILEDQPSNLLAKLYANLGNVYKELDDYKQAFIYFDKSYEIAEIVNNATSMGNALLDIANLYFEIENRVEAVEVYGEAIEIFGASNNESGQAKCHIGLGNIAYEEKRYDEAIGHYNQAIQLGDNLSQSNQIVIYSNKGSIYNKLGQYDKALQSFNTYLSYQQEVGNTYEVAFTYSNIGEVYAHKKDYQQALLFYQKALENLPEEASEGLQSNLYLNMYSAYYKLKDYKNATDYLAQAEKIEEGYKNNQLEAANYKTSYTLAKTENKILESKLEVEQEKQKRQQLLNYSMGGGGILMVFLAAFGFVGYHQRQKRLAAEQEIDYLLTDMELKTTYARLNGQDTERKRIAQDLHDGLGSMLSTVKLYFSSIEEKLDEIRSESRDQYDKATDLLDKACDEVRKVAKEMKSGTLTKFGLTAELQALVKMVEGSKKVEVELVTHGMEERLDSQVEMQIYRIVQELMSNILKHAQATKISIELNRFDDLISLLVEDNGVGFDLEKARVKGGMGITGMEARVKALKGNIDIDTKIGRGTSVSIDIPNA